MSKSFSNLNDLLKHLQKEATKTLQQSSKVKKVVVDELKDSINKNVYIPYTPSPSSPYTRQKDNGGLTDPDNFNADIVADGVEIYSTREGTDRKGDDVYVAEIIEGYKEYSVEDVWGFGYEKPRHFVEPARDSLEKSGKVRDELADEMRRNGFDVK